MGTCHILSPPKGCTLYALLLELDIQHIFLPWIHPQKKFFFFKKLQKQVQWLDEWLSSQWKVPWCCALLTGWQTFHHLKSTGHVKQARGWLPLLLLHPPVCNRVTMQQPSPAARSGTLGSCPTGAKNCWTLHMTSHEKYLRKGKYRHLCK